MVNVRPVPKFRVVHVIYAGLGGHGAVLFSLLESGFLSGCSHFVLFVGVEEPREEYKRRCEELGVGYGYVSRVERTYFGFSAQIVESLRHEGADCVFVHGLAAVAAACWFRLTSRTRKMLILRETQAYQLKTAKEWVFLTLASMCFDRVIYLTNEAAQAAKAKLGVLVKQRNVCIIGNGLDLGAFSYSYNSSSSVIKIGMQSRFQSNKDHSTLLKAFKTILARCPDRQISLHLAGEGSTLAATKSLAEDLGIAAQVYFHGALEQRALVNFLRDLTVYVHSTYGETMSTSIMQALSTGLPVLATDVPGVSNMINGENGVLFRLGDDADLAGRLHSLITSQENLLALSRAARDYAESNFDSRIVQAKYSECIQELIQPKS